MFRKHTQNIQKNTIIHENNTQIHNIDNEQYTYFMALNVQNNIIS